MIAAKDPLGGGFDCAAAAAGVGLAATLGIEPALVAADELPLTAGFGAAGLGGKGLELADEEGFGTTLDVAGETADFTPTVGLGATGRFGMLVA